MLIKISCLHPSLNSWGEIQGHPDGWAFGHMVVSAETSGCLSYSVVRIGMAPCWKGPWETCHPGSIICDCLYQSPPAIDPSGHRWSQASWVYWLLACGTTQHRGCGYLSKSIRKDWDRIGACVGWFGGSWRQQGFALACMLSSRGINSMTGNLVNLI